MPAVGTFHSGTVCEPASWVRLYDQQAAASCEELAEPRLRFEALAHHVQSATVDLSTCNTADAAACAAGALEVSSSNGTHLLSLPFALDSAEATRRLSSALRDAAVAKDGHEGVLVLRNETATGQVLRYELTHLSGAWADELSLGVSTPANVNPAPALTLATIVRGGLDLLPIPGSSLNAPSSQPVVSVRVRQQTSALCAAPDWSAMHVGCYPQAALTSVTSTAVWPSALSLDRCASHCASQGQPRFAVSSSDECVCLLAGAPSIEEELEDGACSQTCSGQPSRLCGGLSGYARPVSAVKRSNPRPPCFKTSARSCACTVPDERLRCASLPPLPIQDDEGSFRNATVSVYATPHAPLSAAAAAACALGLMPLEAAPRLDAVVPPSASVNESVVLIGAWPSLAAAGSPPTVYLCNLPATVTKYNDTAVEVLAPACGAEPSLAVLDIVPIGHALPAAAGSATFRGVLLLTRVLVQPYIDGLNADHSLPTATTPPTLDLPLSGSSGGGSLLLLQGNGFPASPVNATIHLLDQSDSSELTTCTGLWSTSTALLCRVDAPTNPASVAGRQATLRISVEGAVAVAGSFTFSFMDTAATPTVDSISETSGSAAGGLVVCLKGTRLLTGNSTGVWIGSARCLPTGTPSPAQLCCITTAHAVGSASVQLRDVQRGSALFTTPLSFSYVTAPSVLSIAPLSGHAGTSVTITGAPTNGPLFKNSSVDLGGVPATNCVANSDTELVCTAGERAPSAAVAVRVTIPSVGLADVSGATFAYEIGVASLRLQHSLATADVSAGGRTMLVFEGGGFSHLPQPIAVTVGGKPCPLVSSSAGIIVCSAPALFSTEGELDTWGSTSEGANVEISGASCSPCAVVNYTLDATPVLLAISPGSGATGSTLAIFATGLTTSAAANQVLVGGAACDVLSAAEATGAPWTSEPRTVVRVDCVIPLNEAGPQSVRVGQLGRGFDIPRQNFTFTQHLRLLDFTPRAGSLAGGTTLTLTVDGFPAPGNESFAEVSIGGAPCRVTFSNYTTATCVTTAATAATSTLAATVRGNVSDSASCPSGCTFGYTAASTPTLSSASADGLTVSLSGTDFAASGGAAAHQIQVGGVACAVGTQSASSVTCTLEHALDAGTHQVELVRVGWGRAQHTGGVHAISQALSVTSVTPATSSLAGGQLLTVTGNGFGSGDATATQVTVCDSACTLVSSAPGQHVCSSPALATDQSCDVKVSIVTAAHTEASSCAASATLPAPSQTVLTTSCPRAELSVSAGGSGMGDCSFAIEGTYISLPVATSSASFCAVQVEKASLAVLRTACFGDDEYDAAAGFLAMVNGASEGDVMMLATCGRSSPWRSTNLALRKPLLTLGSALAAEGSGPGGWWQASKGAHAFAFIGRRAAGSSGSGLIAEATNVTAANTSAVVECTKGPVHNLQPLDTQTILPHQFYGWGSPSHVAAIASAAVAASSSDVSAAPPTILARLQSIDQSDSATNASGSLAALQPSWLVSAAREALLTLDLGSVRRVEALAVEATAASMLVAAQAADGTWQVVATALDTSDASAERVLSFATPATTRYLKLHLVASTTGAIPMTALRAVRAVGCRQSVDATISAAVSYALASTPRIQQISPRRAAARGGDSITIIGSGFGGRHADNINITLGGIACLVQSYTDSGDQQQVVCTSGAHGGASSKDPWSGPASLIVAGLGAASAANASVTMTFEYINLWSDARTWGNGQFPIEGDTVFIPPGQTILMDVSPPRLYFLVVQGHLEFARTDLTLDASYIFVMGGSFTIGTEASPFLQQAQVTLHGSPVSKELPVYGAKVIACRRCTLDIHGQPLLDDRTWTHLNATAESGATELCLTHPVDWAVYSQIVITSTGFDMNEVEQRTITAVTHGGRCMRFGRPLKHQHLGETRTYGGQSVEMRAEVGLLSRNVVIQGNDFSPLDRHGGHIMLYSQEGSVRDNSFVGRIENAELRYMGQAFQMGRYAVHFHVSLALNNQTHREHAWP